jgi:hypothetical protein
MWRNFLIKRALKSAPKQDAYPGWEAVTHVQLLFEELPNQPRPEIEALRNALEKEGKKVETLIYHKGKKPKIDAPADTYYPNDLTLFRKPRKRIVSQTSQSASVLIDWSTTAKCPNDFVAIGNNALLKLGIGRNLPCFNITISTNGIMPEKVIAEILKYLKMINHG